jgi:hypothetical protein
MTNAAIIAPGIGTERMQEAGASPPGDTPRALTYITALACGVFLALAAHIGLTAVGMGLSGSALDVFFTGKNQINTALAWWTIGIAGGLGSLGAIALSRRSRRRGARYLRLAVAIGFICLLAVAGRKAAAPPGSGAAVTVAANLAAMTLGAFMAFFAAHFAARR